MCINLSILLMVNAALKITWTLELYGDEREKLIDIIL
jgi:hypothetical protein